MEKSPDFKELLQLYLEEKTTTHQEKMLFDYLKNNQEDNEDLTAILQAVWKKEETERREDYHTSNSLNKVWERINESSPQKVYHLSFLKYAAAVVVLFTAGLSWYLLQWSKQVNEPVTLISKTTARGEKVKLVLPDSSVVYLGSNSKITWSSRFVKGQQRKIELQGEAFFEVKHDVSSPFIVQTANLKTQVLGTSFDIAAYPEDKAYSISVRTGKVGVMEQVNGKTNTLSLLTPGMKLVYQTENRKFTLDKILPDEASSWVNNTFVFRDETLAQILTRLERYYNIKLSLKANKLAGCRFNATFKGKSIIHVMDQLKIMTSGRISYKQVSNQLIVIEGEGCE